MQDYKPLQKWFSFVPVLINAQRNITVLKEIEKAYKKESGMISMAANISVPQEEIKQEKATLKLANMLNKVKGSFKQKPPPIVTKKLSSPMVEAKLAKVPTVVLEKAEKLEDDQYDDGA